jgi:hypothetical protein
MQIERSKKKIYWRETKNNCITESPAAIYPHSSSGLEAFSAIQKKTKFKFTKFRSHTAKILYRKFEDIFT